MTDELNEKAEMIVPVPQEPSSITIDENNVAVGESLKKKCIHNCENTDVKSCFKCKLPYCAIHAARFSPNFCKDCFKDLQVVLDKYTRVVEDYDPQQDKLTFRKESCNQIRIDGPD